MMNKLKVLELFGGIGACSKALEKLGIDYEIADYVEIDKYAVKSFNAMHNTNFEPQDICSWNKDIDVDLIMHGSPCQDFSLAGLQAGGDEGSGTRSSLMYETLRIVEKLKPKYVIWENVKNLLSKKHRHNFDSYLEIMESLGYKNYYQVLNAKDYGIPQNRERVFTVSILGNESFEFPRGKGCNNKVISYNNNAKHQQDLLQDAEGICRCIPAGTHGSTPHLLKTVIIDFDFPQKQELKIKLKDMLEDEVDEKYYLSEDKIGKISHWKGFQKPFEKVQGKNSVVPTLTARGAGEEHNGMITFSDNLEDTTNLQEQCLNIKNATKKGYQEAFEGDSVNLVYPNSKTRRGRVGEQVSQTLQCNDSMGVVNNDLRIRKLTPKECWRLMGFDDEDFDKASKVNSNAQLYKQAGNSIVVNVLMAIFNELLKKAKESNK
jgi:DNA (cytosine-5)-methyltransferase 1